MPKDTLKPAVDEHGEWIRSRQADHYERINAGLETRRLTDQEIKEISNECEPVLTNTLFSISDHSITLHHCTVGNVLRAINEIRERREFNKNLINTLKGYLKDRLCTQDIECLISEIERHERSTE